MFGPLLYYLILVLIPLTKTSVSVHTTCINTMMVVFLLSRLIATLLFLLLLLPPSSCSTVDSVTLSSPDCTSCAGTITNSGALAQARNLTVPAAYHTVSNGEEEAEHEGWWNSHHRLLQEAWQEWEAGVTSSNSHIDLPPLLPASRLVAEPIQRAIDQVWQDPERFEQVYKQEHWTDQAPPNGIYTAQLFPSEAVRHLRAHLDTAAASGIPRRHPTAPNKSGLMLHPLDVAGAVQLTEFEQFYQQLFDDYLRPTGRALFPEYYAGTGDAHDAQDAESYAFTAQYSTGGFAEVMEHADPSLVSFVVNLNLFPEETYVGSDLQVKVHNDPNIVEQQQQSYFNLTLQPGQVVAILGRKTFHRVSPIASGTRYSLVVWVRGPRGQRLPEHTEPFPEHERMSARQRWSKRPSSTTVSSSSSGPSEAVHDPELQRVQQRGEDDAAAFRNSNDESNHSRDTDEL